jgi:predicted ATPase/transcriptional regulator with XRE-family HTH domain
MSAPDPATFASLLRRHRLTAGLSQEELAERAGLSARGVSDLERGLRATPRPETIRMLADALGLGDAERAALIAATRPELVAPSPGDPRSPEAARVTLPTFAPVPLPVPPTHLVGRAAERARLRVLLTRDGVRLVTLTGPGGVGKTRLALEVAVDLGREGPFAGAVALVELAALRDPTLVTAAIGRALGISESPGIPVERRLSEALSGRRLLLVLDNCEHLLAAAPTVAELLAASPGVVVLATSRERLRLRGERQVPVPPLSLPTTGRAYEVEGRGTGAVSLDPPLSTLDADAVRLFVERVTDARPDFELTEANAAAVVEICRRLDGLPLALELAAAWASAFPPAALLARLARRLDLLVGGPVDLPERQQTMAASIAWSYDLLEPELQRLLRRVAVFAGGCTIEAAGAVGNGESGVSSEENDLSSHPSHPTPNSVLGGIVALSEKSLLRASEGMDSEAEPRFAMLETIREFALGRLEAAAEAESTYEAHARYFQVLAAEGDRLLQGPAQIATLRRLDAEDANLNVALDWLLTHDPDAALEMASSLWLYWSERGRQRIGRTWLERALAAGVGQGTFLHARALLKLGNLAIDLSEFSEARARYEASLAIWRELDEPRGVASCLTGLGLVAAHQGDHETALARHEESLRLWQAADDSPGVAMCLFNLGDAYLALGDLERAAGLYQDCLDVRRELGDEVGVAYVYIRFARIAAARHEPAEARRQLTTSRDLFMEAEDPIGQSLVNTELARLEADDRQIEKSLRLYRDAIRLRQSAGDRLGAVECVGAIAVLMAGQGALEKATVLFAASAQWRNRMGSSAAPDERSRLEQGFERVRAVLPASTWADRWAMGAELSLEQAAALALRDDEFAPQPPAEASTLETDPLTCVS